MTKKPSSVSNNKIIVIVGPTASGKSDLGIKIAHKLSSEIISADSRQVYRGMDIGTGKVVKDRIKKLRITNYGLKATDPNSQFVIRNSGYYSSGIRHHLIDVASPKKQFTADDFKKLGEKAIQDILKNNKIPIIVGGTGFYIDILLGRMAVARVPADKKLRAKLSKLTIKKLYEKLQKLDPERAKTIDRHNPHRLIRALEIVITTGEPVPPPPTLNTKYLILNTPFQVLWLGINPEKNKLAKRIKKRLDSRLNQGMLREIAQLHEQGVSWQKLDRFGLEYRWLSRWLKNDKLQMTNDEFKNSDEYQNLLKEIIKYSKRQMTWFKKNKEIHWIYNSREALTETRKFLA